MQLPLPVSLPVDETFDSFVAGDNDGLVQLLDTLSTQAHDWRHCDTLTALQNNTLSAVAIVGGEGKGKSHLLYAFCHQLAEKQVPHIYLNMDNIGEWTPVIFDGLDMLPFICLDNIHALAGKPEWEEAFFHFINRVVDGNSAVLIWTSRLGASHPQFQLPDLRSRLSWGLTYQLLALTDEQKVAVVSARAAQRGLRFSAQAIQFLMTHCDRDLPTLMTLLERLDTRSLQEQKKLSVAMVKRELGIV